MNPTYRELDDDVKDALRVIRIQEAVGWGRYRPGPEVFLRTVARRREQEGLRVFLLEVDGKVVGYCEALERPRAGLEVPSGAAYVAAIAVDPRRAREGLVSGFGRWVLEQLAAGGFEAAVADVAVDNVASLNLNATLGARFLGPSPAALAEAMRSPAALRVRLRCGEAEEEARVEAPAPGPLGAALVPHRRTFRFTPPPHTVRQRGG